MSGPGPATLTAALAPLHQAYLRRLEQMAERVPPASLLREATTRDDGGRMVLGTDGLPLCFDVADARSGETFEVRSARFDAPAAARLLVGMLEVELRPGAWEALAVTCRFDGAPVEEDANALASLLRAFAELGHAGAFSERSAAAPWSGRIHGVQVHRGADELCAVYDLGSCPPEALEALARALDGFGRDRAPLAKVILGGSPPAAAT